jgi:hypothetical protein
VPAETLLPVPRPEFARLVAAVMTRMLAQTGQPPASSVELARLATLLDSLGLLEGWARRRAGAGEELPEALVRGWVERVIALFPGHGPALTPLAKQLIKACFQPEPTTCRLSYRQQDASGRCRRQEEAYDQARISGAHCIDCPHWSRERSEHAAWLAGEWHTGAAALSAGIEIYLPEDFRALRNTLPPAP